MVNDVEKMFKVLNNNNINYFVLRDYQTVDNILNSSDIDVYIDKKQKKIVDKLFKNNNWSNSLFNNNKYPHSQYFKMSGTKINMFDIVYGLNYGKKNYSLCPEKISNDLYSRKKEYINIASEKIGIITMIFHIIFDKEYISEKNHKILKQMYLDYQNSHCKFDEEIEKIAHSLVSDSLTKTNSNIKNYQQKLTKNKLLIKNPLKSLLINLFVKMRSFFVKIKKRLSKKTIAFIGMDGSGKSSVIDCIKKIYGDKAVIVYMGLKDFKSKRLEKLVYSQNNTFFGKIVKRILLFNEMFSRYLKYRFSGKVILFDRYLDDIVISSNTGILDKIFFKILFPKPKLKIYLYCSVETSYKRKKDIVDKKLFEKMKKKFDLYYKEEINTHKISTDDDSIDETLNKVADIFNKNNSISIF